MADLPRLREVQAILRREAGPSYLVTLDGNENFRDFASFRAFWEPLAQDRSLAELHRRVVVVEQPVHRDHALDEDAQKVLEGWPDRPPLIIDESDGSLEDLPRAPSWLRRHQSQELQGVVKGIANACLLASRRRSRTQRPDRRGSLHAGAGGALQDLASMAMLGAARRAKRHHYFRGLSLWPQDWQDAAVGRIRFVCSRRRRIGAIEHVHGRLALDSVNSAPFG